MPGFPDPWISTACPDDALGSGWPADDRSLAYLTGQTPVALARQRQRLAAPGDRAPDLYQAMGTSRGWPAPDIATRTHPAKERLGLDRPRTEQVYMPLVDEILGAYRLVPSIRGLSRLSLLAPDTVAAIIVAGQELEDAHCYNGHGISDGASGMHQAESAYRRESAAIRTVLVGWEARCRALSQDEGERLDSGLRAWRDACLGHRGAWVYRRVPAMTAHLDALRLLGVDVTRCLALYGRGRVAAGAATASGLAISSAPAASAGRLREGECELRAQTCGIPGLAYHTRFARCLMAVGVWRAVSTAVDGPP